ncbi:MAG: hypothetical protein OXU20_07890 [Myxococcales bacterium]|nr:hypothetical protein [Myxococcales bacterium]
MGASKPAPVATRIERGRANRDRGVLSEFVRGLKARGWGERGLFLVAVCCSVIPLWLTPYPPLQDLPQHLAAIRVLHSYDDPAYGFAQFFELHPFRTQYLAYYFVADLLSHLFDVRVANLVLLSTAIAAIPYGVRAVARGLGADGLGAWLALPLTYNAHLILGFFNFIAGISLSLFGLALALSLRRRMQRRTAVTFAVVAALCFLTHVVPFAFLALGSVLIALGRPVRVVVMRALPLAPAGVLAIAWFSVSPAGQATLAAAGGAEGRAVQPVHRSFDVALAELPDWMTAVFDPARDTRLLWAWALVLVMAVALSGLRRLRVAAEDPLAARLRRRLLLLPLLAVLAYFAAPSSYAWIWPIAPRFALLAALLTLALLPRLVRPVAGGIVLLSLALFAAHALRAGRAFAGFGREVGRLDDAIGSIPPGRRVAGLIFDRGSRHVRFSPFIHAVAYYQQRRGGAVMFTFADFPQSPFVFRPGNRPPRVRPRWEWLPGRVNPARDLAYYDYVLVRGGPGRIARQKKHYTRTFRSRRWSVWKRTR